MIELLKLAILSNQDVANEYPEWIIGLCGNTIQFVGPEEGTWFHLNTYYMQNATSIHFAKVVYVNYKWELHLSTRLGDIKKYQLDVEETNK